jgi:hypothetical protein
MAPDDHFHLSLKLLRVASQPVLAAITLSISSVSESGRGFVARCAIIANDPPQPLTSAAKSARVDQDKASNANQTRIL